MARKPRQWQEGLTHHVTAHAYLGDCFQDDSDRTWFLQLLLALLKKYKVQIHAYVLMSNHYHLMLSSQQDFALPGFMQQLQARYAYYAQRRYGRRGPFWRSRYYSDVIREDHHFRAVPLYIEANPWRAGITSHPARYRWSSYRANTGHIHSRILTPHPEWAKHGCATSNWQQEHMRSMNDYLSDAIRYSTCSPLPPEMEVEASVVTAQLLH